MTEEKNCARLLDEIMSLLDDELDDDACRRIEEHLGKCPRCRACREILSRTRILCRERVPLSGEHRQALLAKLRNIL